LSSLQRKNNNINDKVRQCIFICPHSYAIVPYFRAQPPFIQTSSFPANRSYIFIHYMYQRCITSNHLYIYSFYLNKVCKVFFCFFSYSILNTSMTNSSIMNSFDLNTPVLFKSVEHLIKNYCNAQLYSF
jgi:hypothetical protein